MPIKTNIRKDQFIYTSNFNTASKRSAQPKLLAYPQKTIIHLETTKNFTKNPY